MLHTHTHIYIAFAILSVVRTSGGLAIFNISKTLRPITFLIPRRMEPVAFATFFDSSQILL